ncbi:hypothetical protein BGZ80_004735 [Entomortierella chlamydospora]|uniref:Uncharacterized protein n=1 Tax=Entomortierella chlamydospora TaxID=101097 RepID=A0A9P6SVW4_9FUNG|nr:hypothetical protein BGZ80_004735 [Entomortierella chlamydospora]
MSLLRHTARRSFNAVLANNTTAFSRLTIARGFADHSPQSRGQDNEIKHAPGWRSEDASESEANVKADREDRTPDTNTEHLQRESVEHLMNQVDHAIHGLKEEVQSAKTNVVKNAKEYANKASETVGSVADKFKK